MRKFRSGKPSLKFPSESSQANVPKPNPSNERVQTKHPERSLRRVPSCAKNANESSQSKDLRKSPSERSQTKVTERKIPNESSKRKVPRKKYQTQTPKRMFPRQGCKVKARWGHAGLEVSFSVRIFGGSCGNRYRDQIGAR